MTKTVCSAYYVCVTYSDMPGSDDDGWSDSDVEEVPETGNAASGLTTSQDLFSEEPGISQLSSLNGDEDFADDDQQPERMDDEESQQSNVNSQGNDFRYSFWTSLALWTVIFISRLMMVHFVPCQVMAGAQSKSHIGAYLGVSGVSWDTILVFCP